MSSTPYRDELLRIAAQLGLPDNTDLTTLADVIATHLPSLDDVAALKTWAGVPPDVRGADLLDHVVAEVPAPSQTVPALHQERVNCALHEGKLARVLAVADDMEVRREKYRTGAGYADLTDLAQQLRAIAS